MAMGEKLSTEDGQEVECWACLRITPRDCLERAHAIWEDEGVAHEMGMKACKMIKESYEADRTFLCGIKADAVLAGLFHLLGCEFGHRATQLRIHHALNVVEPTLRSSYRRWLKRFPGWFPKCVSLVEPWCLNVNMGSCPHRGPGLINRGRFRRCLNPEWTCDWVEISFKPPPLWKGVEVKL